MNCGLTVSTTKSLFAQSDYYCQLCTSVREAANSRYFTNLENAAAVTNHERRKRLGLD